MHFLLVLILVIVVIGMLPQWPHAASWGWGPSSIGGVLLVLLVLWLFLGNGHRYF